MFDLSTDHRPSVKSCFVTFSNALVCFEKLSCCIATNVFVLCNIFVLCVDFECLIWKLNDGNWPSFLLD